LREEDDDGAGDRASISGNQITRVEMTRDGSKVTDLMPTQGFSYSGALQPGRYSFKAFDQYDREVPICNTQPLALEACPAPPPPPPPPPPASCSATASAVKGKAGWDITVDGSGGRYAKAMTFEIVDPAGKVVPFTYQDQTQSAATLGAPFQGTVTIKKLAAGPTPCAARSRMRMRRRPAPAARRNHGCPRGEDRLLLRRVLRQGTARA